MEKWTDLIHDGWFPKTVKDYVLSNYDPRNPTSVLEMSEFLGPKFSVRRIIAKLTQEKVYGRDKANS